MSLPIVAIVGRPNVGKSALFNRLLGRRIAIVDAVAGVTRDRVSSGLQYDEMAVELVDTGGAGIEDVDGLTEEVERQIQLAIDGATVLLLVVDVQAGVTPQDVSIANRVRRAGKPTILVVNKVDAPHLEVGAPEFSALGLGEPLSVSALHGIGRSPLLETIRDLLPAPSTETLEEPVLKLAIVGRRNAGKSTFVNALAHGQRVIVSEVPGTTRDSVDVLFEKDGKRFIAIDTAGVRRKKSVKESVEFYSLCRAESSIRRADVALLFLDVSTEISSLDRRLGHYLCEQSKPCVIVLSKWDLAKGLKRSDFAKWLEDRMPGLAFAPVCFLSALAGKNVIGVVEAAQGLYKQSNLRVSTAEINKVVEAATALRSPAPKRNRAPRIYYGTQVSVCPPTIVLFVNEPSLFSSSYERFLGNQFRKHLPFHDIPVRMFFRTSE